MTLWRLLAKRLQIWTSKYLLCVSRDIWSTEFCCHLWQLSSRSWEGNGMGSLHISYLLSFSILNKLLWLIYSTTCSATSDTKKVDHSCFATLPRSARLLMFSGYSCMNYTCMCTQFYVYSCMESWSS